MYLQGLAYFFWLDGGRKEAFIFQFRQPFGMARKKRKTSSIYPGFWENGQTLFSVKSLPCSNTNHVLYYCGEVPLSQRNEMLVVSTALFRMFLFWCPP